MSARDVFIPRCYKQRGAGSVDTQKRIHKPVLLGLGKVTEWVVCQKHDGPRAQGQRQSESGLFKGGKFPRWHGFHPPKLRKFQRSL